MAPLSHDLSGLILPHDGYGSHLDEKGTILDQELAKKILDWLEKRLRRFGAKP
jgi:hypothetical protein